MRDLKFRQYYMGEFHYWGFDVNGAQFVGPTHRKLKSDQFTGLRDVNGRGIYEGDILGWTYYSEGKEYKEQSVVEWDNSNSCFNFNDNLRPQFCEREVVGNVHEHPELLEGKGR